MLVKRELGNLKELVDMMEEVDLGQPGVESCDVNQVSEILTQDRSEWRKMQLQQLLEKDLQHVLYMC